MLLGVVIIDMPESAKSAPAPKKGYITISLFGNNKVSIFSSNKSKFDL